MKVRILIGILLLICFQLNAQTVIDYSNLSGSTCLFTSDTDVPATLNGSNINVKHRVTVGQVDYSSANSAIVFQSDNSPITAGSEYRIEYNFKQNYTYKIVVSAFSIYNGTSSPYLRLKLTNTTSTTSSCNGYQPIDNNVNGSLINYQSIPKALNDFTFNFPSINTACSYLTLANIATDNVVQTIEIKKITITETAPPVSFTLPSTVNVQCGSTSAVTFTVTTASNPNNLTITDYIWNLGTTPNGWLYNGSPAPQTVSTGTTNSITLTPICGSTLSNISAAVTAGGNIYNTNPSTINRTTPSLSITGNNAICTGSATYSIANLPCDASVTWAASPSGIVSLSCTTCSSTTLTKTGSGNVTLTATVTTSCGNQTITKTIGTGNTVSGYYNVISNYTVSYNNTLDYGGGSVFLPKNQSVLFSIQLTSTDLTSVSWGVSGTYSSYYSGSNFLNLYMMSPSSSWSGNNATVTLNATGPCGSFSKSYNFQAVANGSFSYSMKASPNPAKNNLNITLDKVEDTSVTVTQKESLAKPNATTGITRISLYDFYTNALVKQWTYNDISTMNYNLNISGLHKGLYLLKLGRENKTTTTKVVVK